jgi:hypothetical protein
MQAIHRLAHDISGAGDQVVGVTPCGHGLRLDSL